MNLTESIGYLAAALVLAAFCMRDIAALRLVAVASNIAFIAYGALAGLGPVLLLHLLLLPINVWRLSGRSTRGARPVSVASRAASAVEPRAAAIPGPELPASGVDRGRAGAEPRTRAVSRCRRRVTAGTQPSQ